MKLIVFVNKIRKYIFSPAIIEDKLKMCVYKLFYKKTFLKYYKIISKLHVKSISFTINTLIHSNKSISRFGDGELRWLLNDCHNSFQKSSKKLSRKLKMVIDSNDTNLLIGLPDSFKHLSNLTRVDRNFWELFFAEYGRKIIPYLNMNKIYYNTSISRVYINYRNKSKSKYYFNELKKIWKNRDILIVEGRESRLGVNDDLFNNTHHIYRIECPVTNAFESYKKIFNYTNYFLNNNKSVLTILSLGPTATVLAYDLFKHGHRAIDIGNIDLEYNWFLMKASKKVNIPMKYTVEVPGGTKVSIIHNYKYTNEIIKNIY